MPSTANVSIRLTSFGDVVLDQLIAANQNSKSVSAVHIQVFPPNVSTIINTSFFDEIVAGYAITGVLIVPPVTNIVGYTISTSPVAPDLKFHPTNPIFLPLIHVGVPLYLWHVAGAPLPFTFFWI